MRIPETRVHFIASKRFPQRLDDRNAAGHRRLETERGAACLGERGKRQTVMRQHCLIGRHDGLACLEGSFHSRLCLSVRATNQLDDAIHLTGIRQCHGVVVPLEGRDIDAAIPSPVPGGNRRDPDIPAATRGDCAACRCISETTADPTVPRPATPTRNSSAMSATFMTKLFFKMRSTTPSTPGG